MKLFKKVLCILFFLVLSIGITSCSKKKTITVSNLVLDGYSLTYSKIDGANGYSINILYEDGTNSEELTLFENSNKYNFSDYAKTKEVKSEKFTITFRVKPYVDNGVFSEKIVFVYNNLKEAPTPTNIKLRAQGIDFESSSKIKSYEASVVFNNQEKTYKLNDPFIYIKDFVSDYGEYTIKFKSLKGTKYENDSPYSDSITLNYTADFDDYTLFDYQMKDIDLDKLGFDRTPNEPYKDGSYKFAAYSDYLQTPRFFVTRPFSVSAKIQGRSTSGDAKISFFGLDKNQDVVETFTVPLVIPTSETEIIAQFTKTSIQYIKVVYSYKASGNFGLISLSAKQDDETDAITKINYVGDKLNFTVGDSFEYLGSLNIKYKSGKTEIKTLEELKDDITVNDFNTTTFGDRTCTINYAGLTTTIDYNVSYPYTAYYDDVSNIKVEYITSGNNEFTLISIINKDTINYIDVLIDLNSELSSSDVDDLKSKLAQLNHNNITYMYSINNKTINVAANLLDDATTYNLAPYVYITPSNEYINCTLLDYNYVIAKNITKAFSNIKGKVDFVSLSSTSNNNYVLNLNPEAVIINNNSMENSTIDLCKAIYTKNDNISIYDNCITSSLFLSITNNGFEFDAEGNEIELSSTTEWRNNENTEALHHYTTSVYFYRSEYYGDIIDDFGEQLLEKVKNVIVSTHTTPVNYGAAKTYLPLTDIDPLNPLNMIQIYTGASTLGVWDGGATWNREHVWPKSLSGGLYKTVTDSSKNAGSDLHQLKPALRSSNSFRNNKTYGDHNDDFTYLPREEVRGDIARILFYMSVRYDMSIEELKVATSIDLLITWNDADKVDTFEHHRNNVVGSIQGNYNPFIDNPWLVEAIFK